MCPLRVKDVWQRLETYTLVVVARVEASGACVVPGVHLAFCLKCRVSWATGTVLEEAGFYPSS